MTRNSTTTTAPNKFGFDDSIFQGTESKQVTEVKSVTKIFKRACLYTLTYNIRDFKNVAKPTVIIYSMAKARLELMILALQSKGYFCEGEIEFKSTKGESDDMYQVTLHRHPQVDLEKMDIDVSKYEKILTSRKCKAILDDCPTPDKLMMDDCEQYMQKVVANINDRYNPTVMITSKYEIYLQYLVYHLSKKGATFVKNEISYGRPVDMFKNKYKNNLYSIELHLYPINMRN